MLGLAVPPDYTAAPAVPAVAPKQLNVGGIMSVKPLSTLLAEDKAKQAANEQFTQNDPVLEGLAGRIKGHWQLARQAKEMDIEPKLLNAVRSRRGEYSDQKLSQIKQQGGSEIYMLLFATKARQAKALLGDVLIGAGTEKPWTLKPTPMPDLPPEEVNNIMQAAFQIVREQEMSGMPMGVTEVRDMLQDAKDRMQAQMMQVARQAAADAEVELEDILVQGEWLEALDQFVDDLTTFKTAFMKGPETRMVPQLEWAPGADGVSVPKVTSKAKKFWTRVDPFMIYPAPWSTSTDDGFLFQRHQLSRGDLNEMKGVKGYNDQAIDAVIAAHGANGLHQWLSVDTQRASAEGRDTGALTQRSDLIDALQYWGSVSGQMLRDWGMTATEVPEPTKEYPVECWLIGQWVIKSVINPDPLGRRPYYSDAYSRIPGAFWHNSLYDIVEDCQDMCNAAARALANNLGISSGPQADVNVDRLAPGENIEAMYPWKIWQTKSDPAGSTAKAVNFFQPQSNANELMAVYEKFSVMADEYSGIPRYMAGVEGANGGAGRTASGLSMMIGNASKTIKQLLSSIDMRVISRSVSRLYEQQIQVNPNMRGDLNTIARGAMSLSTREAAQVRRIEFLMRTANPIDLQIMGPEGRAAVLRETAKSLDMSVDDIVPSKSVLRQKAQQMNMAQQAAQSQQPDPSQETLMNGAPVTDTFSPTGA